MKIIYLGSMYNVKIVKCLEYNKKKRQSIKLCLLVARGGIEPPFQE